MKLAVPKELFEQILEESKESDRSVQNMLEEATATIIKLEQITPPLEDLLKSGRMGGPPEWLNEEE